MDQNHIRAESLLPQHNKTTSVVGVVMRQLLYEAWSSFLATITSTVISFPYKNIATRTKIQ